ncbi:MAG: VOC family protein [Pseudomonadota bacterium]
MQQLGLVTLVVPSYEAGISWFCDVAGFTLTQDIDQGSKRWVTVAPPGQGPQILLAQASSEAQRAAIGNQTGGRVAFFLHTDDFARDHSAMSKRGVVFREQPRSEPYGTVAVFEDGFGNLWDLIELCD